MLRVSKDTPQEPIEAPVEAEVPQDEGEVAVEEEVSPQGLPEAPTATSGMVPQPLVVYMTGDMGPFRCDQCQYFSDPDACQIVEGVIDPAGCCNLFHPFPAEDTLLPEEEPEVDPEMMA